MFTTVLKNKPVHPFINFDALLHEIVNHNQQHQANRTFLPAANITDRKEGYKIELVVPGFTKENINLTIDKNVLTIAGEKQDEVKNEDEKITRKEFHQAAFKRSFTLPKSIVAETIVARCENGILVIEIPKSEEAKDKTPMAIPIN
jgi:HSP20 family protein